ncbi:hypothetical protein NQK81_01240 [Amycolatopsis roodepoortensis]|nr:hypothetical protein [Amycolatopsis roodepoortensis]UUV32099.1 hypothetical protein NQK81_01240 [Amycolatopsis roodepoortensis]
MITTVDDLVRNSEGLNVYANIDDIIPSLSIDYDNYRPVGPRGGGIELA